MPQHHRKSYVGVKRSALPPIKSHLQSGSRSPCQQQDQALPLLLQYTEDPSCSPGFYTYAAFKQALANFPGFATTPSHVQNKRELAAFLAQIAHETSGGWPTAPGGPYAWGLCFKEQGGNGPRPKESFCVPSAQWPCAPGKKYWGRGPMQLSYNYK